MALLVTGGAGYIGSVTVELLRERGDEVVVLDNLARGHREALAPDIPFYQGDISDRELVMRIAREHRLEACVHFAALAYVGESVSDPALYFENNVARGIAFLNNLLQAGVRRVVFSSTCATYGEPEQVPISEDHKQEPTNPYGWTKLMFERVLKSYDAAYGLKFVALRYFNAAGATAEHGEDHEPETHLIPNVLAAARGLLPHVTVFGSDYPTPDGTAIRDYIHVSDLGAAHMLALDYLRNAATSRCLNLGTGTGFSVLEVIQAAERVTGRAIERKLEGRRAGDPPRLVAQSRLAQEVLGWQPAQTNIEQIIQTAWDWHLAHPHGYAGLDAAV